MKESKTLRALRLILLCLGSLMFLLPVFIMLITSFKTQTEVWRFPPTWWPEQPTVDGYRSIVETMNMGLLFKNSLFVALSVMILTIFSSTLVGYGFYRYRAPGKKALFMVLICTLMIPYPAIMIPQFILFMNIGWVNTYLPLILPSAFGSAFMIFLVRQFLGTIPYDLFEAASIDGCGQFRAYWNIALPLCGPAIASIAIFTFIWTWDDLLGPAIYLNSNELYTLPIAMAGFRSKYKIIPWQDVMAGAVIMVLPSMAVYLFFQRYFVQGIVMSGMKG